MGSLVTQYKTRKHRIKRGRAGMTTTKRRSHQLLDHWIQSLLWGVLRTFSIINRIIANRVCFWQFLPYLSNQMPACRLLFPLLDGVASSLIVYLAFGSTSRGYHQSSLITTSSREWPSPIDYSVNGTQLILLVACIRNFWPLRIARVCRVT
jgi:hypothetical protein